MLIYSAGLRVSEVVKLKLEDIDAERKLIHIKGCMYEVVQIYRQSGRIYEVRIYHRMGMICEVLQIY